MRRVLPAFLFLLLCSGSVFAGLTFPALTGRVVDEAKIISPGTRQSLEQQLASLEIATTDQLVVVTLKSLRGTTIEDYGYQLGRAWGIGQKNKNNGVLLIVAPKEKKVRIEVGYGLEGTLTDAMASDIVQGTILPQFRAGHMEHGIVEGAQAIIGVLNGQSLNEHPVSAATTSSGYISGGQNAQDTTYTIESALIILAFFIFFIWVSWNSPGGYGPLFYSGSRSGGFGGGFGGGFSGGGGSFGGGGASGGW